MKDAETKKYKEYKEQLAVVRLMSADRRTIQEIMKGVKSKYPNEIINTENDFFDWLKTRNSYVQNYLKEYAKELNKAGKKNEEIAEKIGRSVGYVALLLNSKRQSAMDTGKSSSSAKDETIKQKAIRLAEQDTPLITIAEKLGVDQSKLKTDILGMDYRKKWAKRLADSDTKAKNIAEILNQTESFVYNTLLGEGYIKKWVKRLANDNNSVTNIADYIGNGKTGANVVTIIDDFDSNYRKEWALRLANEGEKANRICSTISSPAMTLAKFHEFLGTSNMRAWAKSLADVDTKVSEIASRIGYTEDTTRSTILGNDYIKSWVIRLSKSGKSNAKIAKIIGLAETTINSYIEKEASIRTTMSDTKKTIQDATKSVSKYGSGKVKQRISKLAFEEECTMTDIVNDSEVKEYYGNKSPAEATIRKLMEKDFMTRWAKLLASGKRANNSKAIEAIAADLGFGNNIANGAKNVRGYLGYEYLSDWAKRTINNDYSNASMTVLYVANKLSVPESLDAKKIEYVHGYLTHNDSKFLKRWAKRLADANKHIPTIANSLCVTSAQVRDTYLGNDYILSYIKRVIKNVPGMSSTTTQKDVKWITETKFGLTYNDNKDWLHNKLLSSGGKPISEYKQWAANLKDTGRTVSQIAAYTGRTNAYVRDTLLGEDIMKAWVIQIVRGTDKTYDDVRSATGLSALDARTLMEKKEFRSWAIRLTKSSKNYKASEILTMIGAIYNKDTSTWVTITDSNRVSYRKYLHNLLEYRYSVAWVKRLSNSKNNLDNSTISKYTGLSEDVVKKYKKAKSVL